MLWLTMGERVSAYFILATVQSSNRAQSTIYSR
jgi:hypothetical protein